MAPNTSNIVEQDLDAILAGVDVLRSVGGLAPSKPLADMA
jgi:hypothetical protein